MDRGYLLSYLDNGMARVQKDTAFDEDDSFSVELGKYFRAFKEDFGLNDKELDSLLIELEYMEVQEELDEGELK